MRDQQFSRRFLIVGLAVAPAVAALLAACGSEGTETADTVAGSTAGPVTTVPGTAPEPTVPDTTSPGTTVPDATTPDTTGPTTGGPSGIDHPLEADSIVIELKYEGGLEPPGLLEVPALIIAGDNRVYEQGVITMQYPGPLVRPVNVRPISEEGVQRLLASASEAGLLATPPDYSGASNVADAADTVVTINAAGVTYMHRAYGLGLDGDGTSESSPARQALQEFVELLGDIKTAVGGGQLGEEATFEPEGYRFDAYEIQQGDVDAMDPEPTLVNWPDSAGVMLRDAAECAIVTAEAIGSLFADATDNTVFTEGDGETASLYRLYVIPVLPGDRGC